VAKYTLTDSDSPQFSKIEIMEDVILSIAETRERMKGPSQELSGEVLNESPEELAHEEPDAQRLLMVAAAGSFSGVMTTMVLVCQKNLCSMESALFKVMYSCGKPSNAMKNNIYEYLTQNIKTDATLKFIKYLVDYSEVNSGDSCCRLLLTYIENEAIKSIVENQSLLELLVNASPHQLTSSKVLDMILPQYLGSTEHFVDCTGVLRALVMSLGTQTMWTKVAAFLGQKCSVLKTDWEFSDLLPSSALNILSQLYEICSDDEQTSNIATNFIVMAFDNSLRSHASYKWSLLVVAHAIAQLNEPALYSRWLKQNVSPHIQNKLPASKRQRRLLLDSWLISRNETPAFAHVAHIAMVKSDSTFNSYTSFAELHSSPEVLSRISYFAADEVKRCLNKFIRNGRIPLEYLKHVKATRPVFFGHSFVPCLMWTLDNGNISARNRLIHSMVEPGLIDVLTFKTWAKKEAPYLLIADTSSAPFSDTILFVNRLRNMKTSAEISILVNELVDERTAAEDFIDTLLFASIENLDLIISCICNGIPRMRQYVFDFVQRKLRETKDLGLLGGIISVWSDPERELLYTRFIQALSKINQPEIQVTIALEFEQNHKRPPSPAFISFLFWLQCRSKFLTNSDWGNLRITQFPSVTIWLELESFYFESISTIEFCAWFVFALENWFHNSPGIYVEILIFAIRYLHICSFGSQLVMGLLLDEKSSPSFFLSAMNVVLRTEPDVSKNVDSCLFAFKLLKFAKFKAEDLGPLLALLSESDQRKLGPMIKE